MEGWKKYEGKRVFIKLKNGREYTGMVLETNSIWIAIKDKFGQRVTINKEELALIEGEKI